MRKTSGARTSLKITLEDDVQAKHTLNQQGDGTAQTMIQELPEISAMLEFKFLKKKPIV